MLQHLPKLKIFYFKNLSIFDVMFPRFLVVQSCNTVIVHYPIILSSKYMLISVDPGSYFWRLLCLGLHFFFLTILVYYSVNTVGPFTLKVELAMQRTRNSPPKRLLENLCWGVWGVWSPREFFSSSSFLLKGKSLLADHRYSGILFPARFFSKLRGVFDVPV